MADNIAVKMIHPFQNGPVTIRISSQELWCKFRVNAEKILKHQNLSVSTWASTNADCWDRQRI